MLKATNVIQPLKVFTSYCHKDERLKQKLITHLSALEREGLISKWHDRMIDVGTEWEGAIDSNLRSADIILLLVSPDFIASAYCYDKELKTALRRHGRGSATVIPVILRPCDWSQLPFGKLQAVPPGGTAVTSARNRDEALAAVARGIRTAVQARRKAKKTAAPTTVPKAVKNEPRAKRASAELTQNITPIKAKPSPAKTARQPKPLDSDFSVYQSGEAILKYLKSYLSRRAKDLNQAGYRATVLSREGVHSLRVEANGRLAYGLDIWRGGMQDGDLAFNDNVGQHTLPGKSMTATAIPVQDDEDGKVKLRVTNFSLLPGHNVSGMLTKEEFASKLWDKVVDALDQWKKWQR